MNHSKLKGRLTISRPRGGNSDYIEISITDQSSGTEFVSARVGLTDFAEALVGLALVDCEFDLRPDRVGMKYEHKEEFVPCPISYARTAADREKIAAKAFKPFEVDGWKGRIDDLFNPHRRNQEGARVVFTRYVTQDTEQ